MLTAHHDRLVAEIARFRLPLTDEKTLQAAVEGILIHARLLYRREVPVKGGIVDFMTGPALESSDWPPLGAVGVELKIKGGKRDIYRQVQRYCEDPRIGRLLVVAGLALALPTEICGKPVTILNIAKAWL